VKNNEKENIKITYNIYMKIIFNTSKLISKIKNIAPTAEAKQTLAILGNMLVKVSDNKAKFIASDLEIEIMSEVECQTESDINFTIPAKKFLEVCNALSTHDEIEVYVADNKADVIAGKSKVSLPTLPPDDFPLMTFDQSLSSSDITTAELSKLINKTSFAMAYQDSRHFLNGLHLCSEEGKLVSVCTDGHRLAKYESDTSFDTEISIIIPRKAIVEINRILASFSDTKENLTELRVNNNSLQVNLNGYLVTSKLIEGNYPNFNKVIPASTTSKISVDKALFKNSLNIISKVTNQQYKGVKLTPSKSALHLITSNTESEIGEDEIDASYDGDDMSIGFNISYIQDVIDTIESDSVDICINDQNSGCILVGPSDTNSVFVIMPMRV
tara:strand:- start:6763 stop:7917 length:1155 start_codon:yes stop_codon:yes gene_type:complete